MEERKETLVIQKASKEAVEGVTQLYHYVCQALEKGINYPGWRDQVYPCKQDAEEGITAQQLYIACERGEIVGSVILNHKVEKGYDLAKWSIEARMDEIIVVHTLVIHPEYARRGIGSKLLELAEQVARQQNAKAVRLDVYEKNLPACRLYEKCGYQYRDTLDLGYSAYGLSAFKLYEKVLE